MKSIDLKCSQCNSWNIDIVHSVFSYYICRDCGACYEEHTMKPLSNVKAEFTIKGKSISYVFSVEEIKTIDSYENLEKFFDEKLN